MLCTSLEYHAFVTLPLVLLAWLFPFAWPVALTSLLLSLGVCTAAAIQADLPPGKRRLWSRPLVAALFFLQPIERGLARYRSRANNSANVRLRESATDSAPSDDESFEHVSYWSKGAVDRYRFLSAITARLEAAGFHVRSDSGWSDFDLEIMGNRWSRLRLTTVTEELEQGRRNFHCRMRGKWSVAAAFVFWTIVAVQLLVIGLVAGRLPWIWLLPIALPFVSLLLDHQHQQLKEIIATQLEATARELNLVSLSKTPGKPSLAPSGELVPRASTSAQVNV
jgi:hypothetical protein